MPKFTRKTTTTRPRGPWSRAAAGSLLAASMIVLACGCRSREAKREVELVVFAASSLTEAFEALEQGFEQTHPNIDVRPSFAGSQILRVQIEHGAEADVFASADARHLDALADAGLATAPRRFATNELVVIVPAANPADIERFADLATLGEDGRIVIGSPEVPIGAYTRALLDRAAAAPELGPDFVAAVRSRVVSEESNVRLVRAKVALGEADAAIVYRTDADADRIRAIEIPAAINVHASYPIAALTRSRQPKAAAAFVDYVRSPAGREHLAAHGFGAEVE